MAASRPRGRPPRYRQSFADNLPEMFRNGESVTEVVRTLGISRKTFYRWVEKYPQFADAYEDGKALSEAWWMTLGRAGAAGQQPVQPALWIFNMKNRFKWRDREDPERPPGQEDLTPEEYAKRAHATLVAMEAADRGDDGSTANPGVDPA